MLVIDSNLIFITGYWNEINECGIRHSSGIIVSELPPVGKLDSSYNDSYQTLIIPKIGDARQLEMD